MEKKPIISVRNLSVVFSVRNKELTAIRNVDLDIYKERVLAIVGESGSGKSVLTKTFSGLLDDNGRISSGEIWYNNPVLANEELFERVFGSQKKLKTFIKRFLKTLPPEEAAAIAEKVAKVDAEHAAVFGKLQALVKEVSAGELPVFNASHQAAINQFDQEQVALAKQYRTGKKEIKLLQKRFRKIAKDATLEKKVRRVFGHRKREIFHRRYERANPLSALYRFWLFSLVKYPRVVRPEALIILPEVMREELDEAFSKVKQQNTLRNQIIGTKQRRKLMKKEKYRINIENPAILQLMKECDRLIAQKMALVETTQKEIQDQSYTPLHKFKTNKQWQKVRGKRIAVVFQDPMTSLNPLRRIGTQLTEVICLHQGVSKQEAKEQAIQLLAKVGIDNPEERYRDYPFQYSGGMRQRVVIAIALACRPHVLICDEPTTALDVTIQAQILELIKNLQKEYGFATIYITHDLGVVANVADDVAVMYGGQIVEQGTVEDIFYRPAHPYTWALLSSLPQLGERGQELFSIPGVPPSLYKEIVGDAFAPRNPFALAIDFVQEPPMYRISETHCAKTWLLHPQAPKIEPPKEIQNIAEALKKFVGRGGEDE